MSDWPDDRALEAARQRLATVRASIEDACARVGREPGEVTVIGAGKRQPLERLAAAVAAGLGQLGENYVQEARTVRPALEALLARHAVPAPRWRMIGHLQRNKARHAVALFDAVDSVDRAALAAELDRRAADADRTLEVCLQINLGGESQKAGAAPGEAESLLASCATLPHLRVVGLMTMPAADPETARAAFRQLRALRDTLRASPGGESLRELNMGMSGDYVLAVEEGATQVRIGTALFGERDAP